MRAPSFLRSISSRLPTARSLASPVVAPLPEESQFSQRVTVELDALRLSESDMGSANWLTGVLGASIATQKLAQEYSISINDNDYSTLSNTDKEMIDDYLEDNIELLDTCNGLVEKMDMVREYVDLLKVATTRSTHAQEAINKCEKLAKECSRLDKCGSKLCRLMGRKTKNQVGDFYELHEALNTSKEVGLVACHRLQRALSFKSKQGRVSRTKSNTSMVVGLSSLNELLVSPCMMKELEELIMASKMLNDQGKCNKKNVDIVLLRKSCESLEEGLKALEERVRELYRHLISIRMALLGILSQT